MHKLKQLLQQEHQDLGSFQPFLTTAGQDQASEAARLGTGASLKQD
jgi:hypothetical protein